MTRGGLAVQGGGAQGRVVVGFVVSCAERSVVAREPPAFVYPLVAAHAGTHTVPHSCGAVCIAECVMPPCVGASGAPLFHGGAVTSHLWHFWHFPPLLVFTVAVPRQCSCLVSTDID